MHNIDWEQQWKDHAPGFDNGRLSLSLKEFGGPDKQVFMKPGAGFGDLSHSTTRLSLKLLMQQVANHHVIDVGCGSGVLGLSAAAAGAKSVTCIDICPDALEHTRQNAILNNQIIILKSAGDLTEMPEKSLIVMNMIRTQQQQAWSSLPRDKGSFKLITSGILLEELEIATTLYSSWGLRVTKVIEESGWLAFLLVTS
jgi:ribosomal protein L11 methyltransferase